MSNGEELAQAIRDKVEDIRITDHIDLSALPQATGADADPARGSRTLPDVTSPTSSIRVCSDVRLWPLTSHFWLECSFHC